MIKTVALLSAGVFSAVLEAVKNVAKNPRATNTPPIGGDIIFRIGTLPDCYELARASERMAAAYRFPILVIAG